MKFTTVTLELGITLSPKQYETIRSSGAATVELSEGEDPNAAMVEIRKLIKKHIEDQAEDVLKNWVR